MQGFGVILNYFDSAASAPIEYYVPAQPGLTAIYVLVYCELNRLLCLKERRRTLWGGAAVVHCNNHVAVYKVLVIACIRDIS